MAVGGLVGLIGALGVAARPDAREHRIAIGLERRARPRLRLRRVDRARVGSEIGNRNLAAVRAAEGLRRRDPDDVASLQARLGLALERIAFTTILAPQIENEAEEEEPERVEHDLCNVQIADGASHCSKSPDRSPAATAGPKFARVETRVSMRARTSGPIDDERRNEKHDLDGIDDGVAGHGVRERVAEGPARQRATNRDR